MLKFLRTKLQSLTEIQLNILTAVLVFINIGIIIFWISFFIRLPQPVPSQIEEESPFGEEIPESLKPGEIGEAEEGEKPLAKLPPVISNTSGTVKEIQSDRLIVLGNGSNFLDREPRELTLIFTDSTITLEPGQEIKYQGFDGLTNLKVGDFITISSSENIRGKIQFTVAYVNKR